MHVGNIFLQVICILMLIEEMQNQKINSRKYLLVGICLAFANSFRSTGFPIFIFYFITKFFFDKKVFSILIICI